MGKGMAIFIVLASKSFLVISAGRNWALLGSLRLMGKHMRFEVLEWSTAVWMRAASPLFAIVVETIAIGPWTVQRISRMTRRDRESACIHALRVRLVGSGVEVGRCSATSEPGRTWSMRVLTRRL